MSTAVRKRRRRRLTMSEAQAKKEAAEDKKTTVTLRRAAHKEEYLKRLKRNMGLITKTASDVGLSRRTPERWRKEDPEFDEAVRTILCEQRDFVEGKIIENINNGNASMQKFYMQCKGHGIDVPEQWVERVEVAGAPDAPLRLQGRVDVSVVREEISDRALIGALSKAMQVAPDLFPTEEDKEEIEV